MLAHRGLAKRAVVVETGGNTTIISKLAQLIVERARLFPGKIGQLSSIVMKVGE